MNIDKNSTKTSILIDKEWIDSSQIKNYMLDDPLIDWLNLYGEKNKIKPDLPKDSDFNNYLQKQTKFFQQSLVSKIDKLVEIVDLSNKYDLKNKINETKILLEKGTYAISNGCLIDEEKKIYSMCDYIIRSDKINSIFKKSILKKKDEKIGSKFNKKWHYCAFNAKFIKMENY